MAQRQARASLGPLENEVMGIVWSHGPATVRDVMRRLGQSERAYTTVMTILSRLTQKGLLRRERADRAYVYIPLVAKDSFHRAAARSRVRALVDEYGDLALAHFVGEVDRVDPARLEELRRMALEDDERPD